MAVREIGAGEIRETVRRLCVEAACLLPDEVVGALQTARTKEQSPVAVQVLDQVLLNADLAREEMLPLCQDSGTMVIFLDIGQDVHIAGGDLHEALREGVGTASADGYLRSSLVAPFSSQTRGQNHPPTIVHTEIVPGDRLRIQVMPKGAGGESMSRFTTVSPGEAKSAITEFVLKLVEESRNTLCPPVIVGLGIGGTPEYAMYMAKRALTRKIGEPNGNAEESQFEAELLEQVNALGVGPQAVGGSSTALAVHMMTFPAHAASLPVAVNLQCHSARLKEAVL
jgi:fumarate hydratase subunit alpha